MFLEAVVDEGFDSELPSFFRHPAFVLLVASLRGPAHRRA